MKDLAPHQHFNSSKSRIFIYKKEILIWSLALGFVVFFGRIFSQGLLHDAALYAGLSLKVLSEGEYWKLSGTKMFEIYAEHPPYFFHWGSWILNVFGTSDGAARAIGAIPAFTAFSFLIIWIYSHFGASICALASLMILSFGGLLVQIPWT